MIIPILVSVSTALVSTLPLLLILDVSGASGATTTTATSMSMATGVAATAAACNNSPSLCSRAYTNVTYMGAHDSPFLRDASTGNSIAGDQYYNATVALDGGIRLLQGQVHDLNGRLELCHTSCALLDAGSLESWLSKIRHWMDGNPNEVVTLLLVNSDSKNASAFGGDFEASGISKYGYTPRSPTAAASSSSSSSTTTTGGWPTLQELIDKDKRLVTFIAPLPAYSPSYPYLLDEFTHVFETPYDVKSLDNFTCNLDRPAAKYSSVADAIEAGMMPLMNHFAYTEITSDIEIPNAGDVDTTNSPSNTTTGALGAHAQRCESEWTGAKPVFILVDFFDRGPAIDAADALNGIQGKTMGRESPGQSSTSDSAARATSSMRGDMGTTTRAVALVAFCAVALVIL
ncbi:PLC-like phosphodiesterase [Podospora didyma]|uniref:PLC-like phosphodiesterase n=1 Tax=Podospora didyma TaxID=330526 RepID=A0AAE0K284_9PEZI|nr:PLC-like phosphodiesterase [Podospora didyma]